jgi:hypothetical protein
MKRLRAHRWAALAGVVGIALIVGAYFVGAGSVDTHSTEVNELEAEAGKTKDQLASVEAELGSVEGDLSVAKGEAEVAREETGEAEEELASERSFKGKGAQQTVAAGQEFETDFPWEAAGTVGHFTFKPVGWERDGESWILRVETKNESHSPTSPFCGGGESVVVDAEGNEYSGDSVLFSGSGDCSGELQPGTTQSFEAEFKIPSTALPVAAAIYGEYEQEEEAKTWELPRPE